MNGATIAPPFADDELQQQLVDPTRRGEHRRGANRELGILRPHHGLVMRQRRHGLVEDALSVQSACGRVQCLEFRGVRGGCSAGLGLKAQAHCSKDIHPYQ